MFSWSHNNNSKSSYPGNRSSSNSSRLSRQEHLKSYLEDPTLRRSTRQVSSDDTTYDTVFQTTAGDTLILRVHIPPSSLQNTLSCPVMTLAGISATHIWLDPSTMRVIGYSALENDVRWKTANLTLGQAVHQVVQEFQLNPPHVLEITDPGLQAIQTKKAKASTSTSTPRSTPPTSSSNNNAAAHHSPSRSAPFATNGYANGTTNSNGQGQQHSAPPQYNDFFGSNLPPLGKLPPFPSIPVDVTSDLDLAQKTKEDLEVLLADELEFLSLVHTHPVIAELQGMKQESAKTNAQLAQSHLDQESRLQELQSSTQSLQKELATLVDRFDALERQQDAVAAPPDVRLVQKQLSKAAKQALDASEDFAEEWVDANENGLGVLDFCTAFVEQRKIHHLRQAKLELLQQQQKDDRYPSKRI